MLQNFLLKNRIAVKTKKERKKKKSAQRGIDLFNNHCPLLNKQTLESNTACCTFYYTTTSKQYLITRNVQERNCIHLYFYASLTQ
jgi:hypothetical protein